ncbi:MAG: hypothetical protein U0Q16_04160 [Bryobacteraceae bacterium]
MLRVSLPLVLAAALTAQDPQSDLLPRFRAHVKETLRRLPDYTCLQTTERTRREAKTAAARKLDTLRLQVALIGRKERYSWADAPKFEERELRDIIGKGVINTGSYAAHIQHVLLSPATEFAAKGTEKANGRDAARFDFEIPVEHSSFKISVPPEETEVGAKGSIWMDPESLDLLRLEVKADEIPRELGIDRLTETIDYSRAKLGDEIFLLPSSAVFSMVDVSGEEHRNSTRFGACRQFHAESKVRFDAEDSAPTAPVTESAQAPKEIPERLSVEMTLDHEVDAANSSLGDAVRAVVSKPARKGETIVIPEGAVIHGRLVRIERDNRPFDHWVLGLEMHTLEIGEHRADIRMTMADAGPAPGLLRQTKSMDPVFTKRRTTRFDILVREKPRGEGVLHWDAKQPKLRKGLKMRWITGDEE